MDFPLTEYKNLHNEIHIWTADLDQLKINFDHHKYLLPDHEREKAKRFRFEILKTRYIKGHYLLRLLLGQYLGIDFFDQEFHINKYGKPSLKNTLAEDSIYFNMSNSENICVYAFTKDGDVGVDMEKIHDMTNMDSIVERFFSPSENIKFCSLPEHSRKKYFFKYWTRKEALLKAMGTGLSFPLDKIDVISGQEELSDAFIKTTELNSKTEWTIQDINIFEGFASAFALKGNHLDCAKKLQYFQLA
jgi:4'-phosphopantetheinyl transferase